MHTRAYSCASRLAISVLILGLSGCALTSTAPSAPENVYSAPFQGVLHGGQQPISGAHIFLFAANTTGYGNASVSLLGNATNTKLDTSSGLPTSGDYYVTTASDGTFSITGDYTCASNDQIYLYALGGNPGAGVNTSASALAILGQCPSGGSFAPTKPYVVINEVSTIAAAYAFEGFATDATHVSSSGRPLALVGIANAFANAANIADLATGNALTTTPAGNGFLLANQTNTLANILAACINSNGGTLVINAGSTSTQTTSPCSTLFSNATSDGTATGTQPVETATAAINIAHNPGSNIAALYGLQAAQPPFQQALSAKPIDFTIEITFSGGGASQPTSIAIDAAGNAWMANNGESSIAKFSPLGVALSPTTGYTGGGLSGPRSIAIDASGNAWVADDGNNNNSVSEFSSAGAALSPSTGYPVGPSISPYFGSYQPFSVAVDAGGNIWTANSGDASTSKLVPLGTSVASTVYRTQLSTPYSVAVDANNDIWLTNVMGSYSTTIAKFGNDGTLKSGSGFSGGGILSPYAIAIAPNGNAWITNYGVYPDYITSVSELSASGVPLSPSNSFSLGGTQRPMSISLDGNGKIWITNYSGGLVELSSTGTIVSPQGGYRVEFYIGQYIYGPEQITSLAIDGSGNIWVANGGSNNGFLGVTEYIGIATPVVTPMVANLLSPYFKTASKP